MVSVCVLLQALLSSSGVGALQSIVAPGRRPPTRMFTVSHLERCGGYTLLRDARVLTLRREVEVLERELARERYDLAAESGRVTAAAAGGLLGLNDDEAAVLLGAARVGGDRAYPLVAFADDAGSLVQGSAATFSYGEFVAASQSLAVRGRGFLRDALARSGAPVLDAAEDAEDGAAPLWARGLAAATYALPFAMSAPAAAGVAAAVRRDDVADALLRVVGVAGPEVYGLVFALIVVAANAADVNGVPHLARLSAVQAFLVYGLMADQALLLVLVAPKMDPGVGQLTAAILGAAYVAVSLGAAAAAVRGNVADLGAVSWVARNLGRSDTDDEAP